MHTAETGREGERLAVTWLRRHGYIIHDLNWRSGHYEIDIIASRGGSLHFVEVKTRSAMGWSSPEEAMTSNKCRALLRGAAAYLSMHRLPHEPQFDLIAVDILPDGSSEIRHIENVIQSGW